MALLQTIDLSFTYPEALEPLFDSLSVTLDSGWTGVVGANGSGKTTLLRLAVGDLTPTGGVVAGPVDRMYCDQRVERVPEDFDDFLNSWDERSIELMRHLGIEYEWLFRWNTLSFGERKRAQLASALWRAPAVLAVDEPSNHLDADSRALIRDTLLGWEGTGLIVSHDRDLLDHLCTRTLFLANGAVVMRPGGVSHGLNEEHRERVEQERTHRQAEREERRLRREAQRRTEAESRSAKRLSKRTVDRQDKDTKRKIDIARISGKDRRGSDAAREMRARANEAGERRRALGQASATFILNDGAVSIDACAVRGDLIAAVEAGVYPAGKPSAAHSSDTSRSAFTLEIPRLDIRPTDRIAVCGPNGAGKSTLLELISHRLHSAGRDIFYIRQELSTSELRRVRERLDALDNTERGRVLAIITRLGSNPERVMDTLDPSPGEARKLALALASLRSPQALLLDEPTNHLDLPGIIALENSLNKYGGCLLVVSHDRQFAGRVTSQTWQLDVRECDGGLRRGTLIERSYG